MLLHVCLICSLMMSIVTLSGCMSSPPSKPDNLEAGSYDYVIDYMNWYIDNEMDDNDIVGLSVALIDDQKIVWQKGFGYADKKNKVKATPLTRYRAGSITKVFTAMAAMQLVEQGGMNIDKPLAGYLSAFSINSRFSNAEAVTPRTIMTHHSGLPSDWLDGMWVESPVYFTQVVDEIKNQYVSYPPNKIFSYSNLGFTLLGNAIENVSSQKYAKYMQESLLKPLGMESSQFKVGLSGDTSSKSYSKGDAITEVPLRDVPAGGLNTTVSDLARLAMMINNNGELSGKRILSIKSIDDMFTVQNKNIPLDLGLQIGLSWFFSKVLANNENVYGHGGTTLGHRASFFVAPKSKLGVVVLANSDTADVKVISEKILQLAWEAKTGEKYIKPELKKIEKQSNFSGVYSTTIGKIDIEKTSIDTFLVKSGTDSFSLSKHDDGRFYLKYLLFGFIPISVDELDEIGFSLETIEGHQLILAQVGQDQFLAGEKLSKSHIADAWKKRLGQYEIVNQLEPEKIQIHEFELKLVDGFLIVNVGTGSGNFSYIIKTLNNDEAINTGMGRGFNETITVTKNQEGVEVINYSGLRFVRLPD